MRDVFWSSDALDDLDAVITYIAAENPRAALDVIDKIERTGHALGTVATGRKGRVSGTYDKVVLYHRLFDLTQILVSQIS